MTRGNRYWINRSNERMNSYHKDSDEIIAKITKAYDQAVKNINADIENIFTNFELGNELTPRKAIRLLNSNIPNPLFKFMKNVLPKIKNEEIRQAIITRIEAKAYKARITRLEALKESIYLNTRLVADVELRESRKLYIKKIDEAYYRGIYDLQRGVGVGFNVAEMPVKLLEEILKHPWNSKHYSSRVWNNVDTMSMKLEEVILEGIMSGKSYRKMAMQLEELSELGKFASERLIRTEMTYFTNQAEIESYKECGIEKVIYVATLDSRTSKACQKLDRKVILLSEINVGVNYPPMHPFCRSTTRAYVDDNILATMKRRARNPDTGKTYLVPANMSFIEWKAKYAS